MKYQNLIESALHSMMEEDQMFSEGVVQRFVANTNGVVGAAKGLLGNKPDGQTAMQAGHESRYGSLAQQYFGKVLNIVTKFAQYLQSQQQTMTQNGMTEVYNQYVDKIQNIVNILSQNAQALQIQPNQLPQVPQKAQEQNVPQFQDEEGNTYNESFKLFNKLYYSIIEEEMAAQPAPQPQTQPPAQPQQPAQQQGQSPGGEKNMEAAKKVLQDFFDKLFEHDDENGPGRQQIMLVLQNISKGMTPQQALQAAGMDQATVQKNKSQMEQQGINVDAAVKESLQIHETGDYLYESLFGGNKNPTDVITKKLQSFERNLSSVIGEMSADLKDMGFNKKFDAEMKTKSNELKNQLKAGQIDQNQYQQQLAQMQQQMQDGRQNEQGIDGVINQLRKSVLQNVDVSLRGKDGMSGKQGWLRKVMHWGGRAGMATLIGMAVNAVIPGFSALGMAGPYVSKALAGGTLSVIRDASTGQLDKNSFKRALIGATVGALAQFSKEVMSAPEIVRTDTKNIAGATSHAEAMKEVSNDAIQTHTGTFTDGRVGSGMLDVIDGKRTLTDHAEKGIGAGMGEGSGLKNAFLDADVASFKGKAGNLGTMFRSLFDQRVKDQLGDNAVAVDMLASIDKSVNGTLKLAQMGKLDAGSVAKRIQSARENLADALDGTNTPEQSKEAILRQFDYSSKQVMGRIGGIGARLGRAWGNLTGKGFDQHAYSGNGVYDDATDAARTAANAWKYTQGDTENLIDGNRDAMGRLFRIGS